MIKLDFKTGLEIAAINPRLDFNGNLHLAVVNFLRQSSPICHCKNAEEKLLGKKDALSESQRNSLHFECGAIECSTTPTFDFKQILEEVDNFQWATKLFGYKFRHEDETTIYGSGGLHIHVEIPEDLRLNPLFYKNAKFDAINRPYLGWMFMEFFDRENDCYESNLDDILHGGFWANGCIAARCPKKLNILHTHENKDAHTLEFRMFDAPKGVNPTEDAIYILKCIAFCHRWMHYLCRITRRGFEVKIKKTSLLGSKQFIFTPEKAISHAKTFFMKLGLDYHEYEELEENIYFSLENIENEQRKPY